VGALSGTALAGNGNGSSANAPGQTKKETAAPAAGTSGQASPGQQKQEARAAGSASGVKPSNNTKHDTTCYTGGGSSSPACTPGAKADSSKQYGNGKTAAQIAASRGAPAGTKIWGPGNSQPHKVMSCQHPTHGVDVHAVKHYGTQDC